MIWVVINNTCRKWINKHCCLLREAFCLQFSLISHEWVNVTNNIFHYFEDYSSSSGCVAGSGGGGGSGRSDLLGNRECDAVEFSD